MTREEFFLLIDKHLEDLTTDQEKQQLINFTSSFQDREWDEAILGDPELLKAEIYGRIKKFSSTVSDEESPATDFGSADRPPIRKVHFLKTPWLRYAAAVLLIFGVGAYLFTTNRPSYKAVVTATDQKQKTDVYPGSDKAILTLADGKQIRLDSTVDTRLIAKGIANSKSLLSYSDASAINTSNTLSTPRGGQYTLRLSDGTMVWLNAESSITYPVAFTGKRREVSITGEAYFEVAKNARKPFYVKVSGMEVEVLGTHFNIDAYRDDNAIKTTLLEGSVKVSSLNPTGQGYSGKKPFLVLRPGQQARVAPDRMDLVPDADINMETAWRNGFFFFKNADLKTVLSELARWYDLDVVYKGPIPSDRFGGKIRMDVMASQVLSILEKNQIHFELEGKKLIVLP